MIIWKRKLYRVVMGGIFPTVYLVTSKPYVPLFLVSFFLTILLALEMERYRNPDVWNWILARFGGVFKTLPGTLTGETYFMISAFISILLFPFPVAVAGLYFLVFGDAVSAFIGTRLGKTQIFPNKTLEGTFAEIFCNVIIAFFLSLKLGVNVEILLTGAVLGTIMEILPVKIDDNLSVGIVPGIVMSLLLRLR